MLAKDAERIRARCQTLAGFVREAWHVLEPTARYTHGWHIDAICEHLEAVTDGRINRLLINVPPGSSKSLLVSVFWQAWEWGPRGLSSMRYLTTSFNDGPVKRDTRKCRDLMLSEWYRSLWPEVELNRTGETSFSNTKTGTREGVAFGSLTSQRGDRLVIDDPHSTETAESPTERQATTRKFREGAQNRLNDQVLSAMVVIMQRLHEDDVSGVIKSVGMDFVHLMLPMEFEPERACRTSIGFQDPRTEEGELLDPVRFPREAVEKLKRDMGSYAYAGQYQQRPAPREGGLFKAEWLKPCLLKDMPARGTITVYGASDYAVTANGGDYTVHGVIGIDASNRMWLLDIWRKQAASDQWVEGFCDMVLHWKPIGWAEETGQIKSGVGPFLQRRMRDRRAFVAREAFPTRGDKAIRAQSIRGRMALDGLYVPIDAPWYEAFASELLTFPASKNDDQVDMLGLIGQLLDKMWTPPKPKTEETAARQDYRSRQSDDSAGDWVIY